MRILEEFETLVKNQLHAGRHSIQINSSDLPTGVYFYKLISGNFVSIKKMVIM